MALPFQETVWKEAQALDRVVPAQQALRFRHDEVLERQRNGNTQQFGRLQAADASRRVTCCVGEAPCDSVVVKGSLLDHAHARVELRGDDGHLEELRNSARGGT